jgi:hypothetical protein
MSNRPVLNLERLEGRETPATLTVNSLAWNQTAGDGKLTLLEAILAVENGVLGDASAASQVVGAFGTSDLVQFDASLSGTIVVTNTTLSNTPLTKGFELRGPGASVLTIQNQTNNIARFLTLNAGNFTVSGLTITDFVGAGGDGGAIRLPFLSTANLTVDKVWFLNNKANFGGAIDFFGDGNLTITNSTFSGNTANNEGGAILYASGPGFSLTITNSTFSGNTANTSGGAIVLGNATGTIRASTIVNNTADADGVAPAGTGGGIFVSLGSNLTLLSSIVAGNKAGTAFSDIDGTVVTAGSTNNLVGTNQGLIGITNGTAGNLIGAPGNEINPFVGPLQNNGGQTPTHALLAGSKAINAGISIMGVTTDQRGFARITGPAPDIGAFETNARWLQQGVVGNNDNGGLEQYNFTIGNNPFTPNNLANPFGTTPARVAYGDVNGDGFVDTVFVTAPGPLAAIHIRDGKSGGTLLATTEIFPGENFTLGAYVAVGDIDGDGRADIVITPDVGGGPRVQVFKFQGANLVSFNSFFSFPDDPGYRGGLRVTLGDVNGDGFLDIVVAAAQGGGPRVTVFDGKGAFVPQTTPPVLVNFFAYEDTLRDGAFVAAGDIDGDGKADIITTAGLGGSARVRVFTNIPGLPTPPNQPSPAFADFNLDPDTRGGATVAAVLLDDDNLVDLLIGTGANQGGNVRVRLGSSILANPGNPAPTQSLNTAFTSVLTNGLFVG